MASKHDPKPKFSKMGLFQEGWANHYDGMIDWIGSEFGGGNVSVNPQAMTVSIDGEETTLLSSTGSCSSSK